MLDNMEMPKEHTHAYGNWICFGIIAQKKGDKIQHPAFDFWKI
jgi:hypothetical protein